MKIIENIYDFIWWIHLFVVPLPCKERKILHKGGPKGRKSGLHPTQCLNFFIYLTCQHKDNTFLSYTQDISTKLFNICFRTFIWRCGIFVVSLFYDFGVSHCRPLHRTHILYETWCDYLCPYVKIFILYGYMEFYCPFLNIKGRRGGTPHC